MKLFASVTRGWLLALLLLGWPGLLCAQEPPGGGHDASELAKASQNPVGDLISLPFQFNFNTGGGLEDRTFFKNSNSTIKLSTEPSRTFSVTTFIDE